VKHGTSSASEAKVEVEVVWPIRQEDEKIEARAQFKMNESANSPARTNGQARFIMTYGYRSSKAFSPYLILRFNLAPTSRYRRERLKCWDFDNWSVAFIANWHQIEC